MTETLTLITIYTGMVFFAGSVASMAWRSMADLPVTADSHDRRASIWIWSAILFPIAYVLLPSWAQVKKNLVCGNLSFTNFVFVASSFLLGPLIIGYVSGAMFRNWPIAKWLTSKGLLPSRGSTPWVELMSPSNLKHGFRVYFRDRDVSYVGEAVSVDHDATQILLCNVQMQYKDMKWSAVYRHRKALYFPQTEKVLWFDTNNEID